MEDISKLYNQEKKSIEYFLDGIFCDDGHKGDELCLKQSNKRNSLSGEHRIHCW